MNSCLLGCLLGGGLFYCIHQHSCCGAMYSCGYRRKLRLKYGLPEQPCDDYCTECCCLPCSLAQQTRELKSRGVDPNLGKKIKKKNPLSFKLQTLSLVLSLLLERNSLLGFFPLFGRWVQKAHTAVPSPS